MVWSRYNFLFHSEKHGFFLYNSASNSFIKLNEELFILLKEIQGKKNNINELETSIKNNLIKAKVFVDKNFDDNYILQEKLRKNSFALSSKQLQIVIAPSLACNFACPYCYEHGVKNRRMTDEVINNLIKFITNYEGNPPIELTWYGGEPLLAFDTIKNILYKLNEQNVKIETHGMVTNGYLLNKDVIDYFKETKLNNIQITIDGTKERHDVLRKHKSGVSTYDTILGNIDIFTDEIPQTTVNIRVNISKENEDDFPTLYRYLKKRYNGKNCVISPALIVDHGGCSVGCLTNKDKLSFLKNLYFKHGINDVEFFPELVAGGLVCTANKLHSYIIDPVGNMYKCWVDIGKKERIIGNLENKTITNPELVSRYVVNTDKFEDPKCLNCSLFPVCDGGCGLFRLENQLTGVGYDVCPINRNEVDKLLEAHYEQNYL